jgi:hypothetical protein
MTKNPKLLKVSSEAEMAEFENDCFRSWLNRIDARIDYDIRRKLGTVRQWRALFDLGKSCGEAVEAMKRNEVFDLRTYEKRFYS